jgi:hypothetical protein
VSGLAGYATDTISMEDQTLVYRQAYRHGCSSGYASAGRLTIGFAKDVQRYTNMPLYKQGWIDGFNVYESRYEESIDESTEDYDYY